MQIGQGIAGTFFIILAAVALWHVRGFPSLPGHFYGPGFFPTVILLAIIACGLVLAVRAARAPRGPDGFTADAPSWRGNTQGVGSVALLVVAVLAFYLFGERIGFHPIAFATMFAFYMWLGRGVLWSMCLAVGLTLAFDLLFRKVLMVPLPRGLMPLLW